MAPTTTFLCPYCFDVSKLSQVKYRCHKCGRVQFIAQRGLSKLMPFAASASLKCPRDGTAAAAVCPKCEHKLPEGSLTGTNSIISIVGSRASGKSHFVGVLIHELRQRVAADFGTMFVGFDKSHETWEIEFGNRLYGALQALDLTTPGVAKEPLIYELIIPSKLGFNRMYTFAFFDTAGENFRDEDQMTVINKYIYQSEGIIFLFDPLQIRAVSERVERSVRDGSTAAAAGGVMGNQEILQHVARLIWHYKNQREGSRIGIPAAVVFTKLDAISDLIPPDFTVLSNSPHSGEVMLNDLHNVDQEVRALLREWDESSFIAGIDAIFPINAFFADSALGIGNHPDASHGMKIQKPRPHRIEDPFLWLLASNHVLRSRK
jgi:GTPase SAR1 family protein